jgi:hypothetical protein
MLIPELKAERAELLEEEAKASSCVLSLILNKSSI